MKFRSILDMSPKEAKNFFLKQSNYCNIDLPPYFNFNDLLQQVSQYLENKNLNDLIENPKNYENINYSIIINKDGKNSWRKLEIIHPVLFVNAVNTITQEDNWQFIIKRFKKLHNCKNIYCMSIPVESLDISNNDKEAQISNWWSEIEQKSLELALDYDILI